MTPAPDPTTLAPARTVEPLVGPVPDAPDRDWQSLRDDAMGQLRESTWTDHNISDPGVTIVEAAMASVAEAHARTAMFAVADAPISSALWRDHPSPSGIGVPTETLQLAELATGLADHVDHITDIVEAANDRAEAVAGLASSPLLSWGPDLALAAVHVVRRDVFNRAALDLAGALDAAVDAVGVTNAAALMRLDPSFSDVWDAELDDLLELRRRRRLSERVVALQDALEVVGVANVETLIDTLDPDDLPTAETEAHALVRAATSLISRPAVTPETFEADDGSTIVWPPTGIQARATEPVIAEDYVDIALAVDGVRRAWVRRGHQDGLAWNGQPIAEPNDRPGTLTILIEPDADAIDDPDLEHRVLQSLADPGDDPGAGELAEVDHPYALYRDDLTRATPRRMICDELAAARLGFCMVEVRGALHVAVGTVDNRAALISEALARVDGLFLDGRPEATSSGPNGIGAFDGPWPPPPPPPSGWIPGEAIRFNEVIERLADDPVILGVSDVALRVDGGAWYRPAPDDIAEFALASTCVPRLSANHCVTVAFMLEDTP